MRARSCRLLLGALLTLGCSDLTSPERLSGTWRQDITIPGSGVEFTLATNGNAVSGTGQWTGEACCSGTVTVDGNETGGDVKLSLTFVADAGAIVPARTETFEGRLVDANTLSGTIGGGAAPATVSYRRVR